LRARPWPSCGLYLYPALLRSADGGRADRRRRVDDGGRGSAGRRGGDAVVVGGGGLDLELEALVALLHLIAGAGADHGGVVVGLGAADHTSDVLPLPGTRPRPL